MKVDIDWVKKLTSRKFWIAICGFVSALLVAFHVGENDIAQVTAIISAFGTLVVYILSEGSVDKANALSNQTVTSNTTTSNMEKTYTTLMNKDLNATATATTTSATVSTETDKKTDSEKVKVYG